MRKGATFFVIVMLGLSFIFTLFYTRKETKLPPKETRQEAQSNKVLGETGSSGNPQVRPMVEWLNDDEFAIYRGCGTECEAVYIFNLKENFKQKLYYGVKHTWSPNKKYVLGYHYAIQPGITVGDKFGNELFTLRREYPQNGESRSTHKAVWSPNSSKLALIINKDKEQELELLVFNIENGFKLLLQKDLNSSEFTDFGWKDEKTAFYTVDGKANEIKL